MHAAHTSGLAGQPPAAHTRPIWGRATGARVSLARFGATVAASQAHARTRTSLARVCGSGGGHTRRDGVEHPGVSWEASRGAGVVSAGGDRPACRVAASISAAGGASGAVAGNRRRAKPGQATASSAGSRRCGASWALGMRRRGRTACRPFMVGDDVRGTGTRMRAADRAHDAVGRGRQQDERAVPTPVDRKSTRLNSSHSGESRMPSSA